MMIIPNPLELDRYPHGLRQTATPRLIWLRAFHALYNPSLAATVSFLLARDYPEVELTMVGPDKGDGSLKRTQDLAKELGVAGHVTMTSGVPKEKVPSLMRQADVFLNTTNVDNTPISVIEAMACGLCIVSTNVGGIPYLLAHEHTALLVPPNDAEAMATAVRRILTEPDLARRLSENARRAVEQFDWQLILPKWDALMLALARNDGRQPSTVTASQQAA